MNTPVVTNKQKDKSELIAVLSQSLYVGAKLASIAMVVDYCQAAGLDPMQKPVHIVPMNTKDPVTGNYEWRDVIMAGIGLYRIIADRSGTLAGISEPIFGDDITQELTDKNGNKASFTFPEWCSITVKKLVGNHIVEFTAKEYWLENYSTDSGKSTAPNAMWKKRPKGQIAKCAESQVLRKGWPEVGQAPTAEEMEGKTIEATVIPEQQAISHQPQVEALEPYEDDRFKANFDKYSTAIATGKKTPSEIIASIETRYVMTEEQKATFFDIEVTNNEEA